MKFKLCITLFFVDAKLNGNKRPTSGLLKKVDSVTSAKTNETSTTNTATPVSEDYVTATSEVQSKSLVTEKNDQEMDDEEGMKTVVDFHSVFVKLRSNSFACTS